MTADDPVSVGLGPAWRCPGDEFSSDLLAKVESSSLLVLLLSQNYVDSTWCGNELDRFIRVHCADPERPTDVFVVELTPFERHIDVPPNIQLLRKQLIDAKFWYQRIDAHEPSPAGYPSALDCEPDGRQHYWNVLNQFRGRLDALTAGNDGTARLWDASACRLK
jgi:hypothetical protein